MATFKAILGGAQQQANIGIFGNIGQTGAKEVDWTQLKFL
jgi:hypothetical protein